jgi:hypothetical protein
MMQQMTDEKDGTVYNDHVSAGINKAFNGPEFPKIAKVIMDEEGWQKKFSSFKRW